MGTLITVLVALAGSNNIGQVLLQKWCHLSTLASDLWTMALVNPKGPRLLPQRQGSDIPQI